ncbi:MAG: hypothetical protein IPK04_15645 [Bdellovibrionales bacterium]|nr:hypothetical protein [Bdellovibrionales bacterium]
MRFEKRSKKNGDSYYSFLYWDPKTKRRVRLRKSEVPGNIFTDKQAEEFARIREAELKAFSLKVKRELQWKSQFYDFDRLLEIYAKRKVKRPTLGGPMSTISEQYIFVF